MVVLVVAVMALFGGTAWLAMQQSVARNSAVHHRLTGGGLALCLLAVVAAVVAATVALIATG
jgi:hypothetical protein